MTSADPVTRRRYSESSIYRERTVGSINTVTSASNRISYALSNKHGPSRRRFKSNRDMPLRYSQAMADIRIFGSVSQDTYSINPWDNLYDRQIAQVTVDVDTVREPSRPPRLPRYQIDLDTFPRSLMDVENTLYDSVDSLDRDDASNTSSPTPKAPNSPIRAVV